jgi:hypothetical protein
MAARCGVAAALAAGPSDQMNGDTGNYYHDGDNSGGLCVGIYQA